MSENTADPLKDAMDRVLDAARIGVGFAIIALQRAQVVAREVEAELERRFPPARP